MKAFSFTFCLLAVLGLACRPSTTPNYSIAGAQSQIIVDMIQAVNDKNPDQYVQGFADSVQVFVADDLRVDGKAQLKSNRAQHFKTHPELRSVIQHLVEIDDQVILHDKIWLKASDKVGQDIVEIFTFKNGAVIRVDVIQSRTLFQQ